MFGVPNDATLPKEPSLDEINVQIPRRVRLSDDGRNGLWITLASLVIGLAWLGALSSYLIHQKRQHDALAREGLEAPARVTKMLSQKHGYDVYYTFQVGGVDFQNDVSSTNAPSYPHVGSQIPVLYLASDPSINYPKGWGWWDFAYLVFFLIGGLILRLGIQTAWILYCDWHLAHYGFVTEGAVTLCVPNKSRFMVDYEFHTQSNFRTQQRDEVVEGSNNNCPDEYKTGTKIRVIYLPHHPSRNTTYPQEYWQMVEHKAPDGPFITARS